MDHGHSGHFEDVGAVRVIRDYLLELASPSRCHPLAVETLPCTAHDTFRERLTS